MEGKQKIGLVCDEGGDLPKELIEKNQITIIPFKIDLGEMKNIYQKIREAERQRIKSFVKTSQPSPGDFLFAFKEKLKRFEKVICITITSKHSGTYNSAIQAKNFLEANSKNRIEIFDSLSGSAGEGLLILKAASLIKKGLKIKEILRDLKESISKTHLIFMLEDPKWLEASGRLPSLVVAWLRGMQKIGVRPLLGVKKGEIKPIGIKKGVKDIATALFKEFETKLSKLKSNGIIKVAITHADNLKEAIELKEMVQNLKNTEISFINLIGNILGGLTGPGALALTWQESC
ncbi:hypothetical protein AMJ49_00190 [Parcubacteria bacterium DG_74_2]|nr:MAG: hypothetical protein AMJ49_00190 [Parcubacteria bacterium DG_74_2]